MQSIADDTLLIGPVTLARLAVRRHTSEEPRPSCWLRNVVATPQLGRTMLQKMWFNTSFDIIWRYVEDCAAARHDLLPKRMKPSCNVSATVYDSDRFKPRGIFCDLKDTRTKTPPRSAACQCLFCDQKCCSHEPTVDLLAGAPEPISAPPPCCVSMPDTRAFEVPLDPRKFFLLHFTPVPSTTDPSNHCYSQRWTRTIWCMRPEPEKC